MRTSAIILSYATRTFCCMSADSFDSLKTRLARSYISSAPTRMMTRIAVATSTSASVKPASVRRRLGCCVMRVSLGVSVRLDGVELELPDPAGLFPADEYVDAHDRGVLEPVRRHRVLVRLQDDGDRSLRQLRAPGQQRLPFGHEARAGLRRRRP